MFKGVFPRDNPETYKWFRLADDGRSFSPAKQVNLRLLEALTTRITQKDVSVSEDLARKWPPLKQTEIINAANCVNS